MTNFLGKIFKAITEVINDAEKSFLDLLSALVPYAVPVIPAYLTYFHTRDIMHFPDNVAKSAAFVVEVLGITSVSTAIRFWRHNLKYKTEANRAPFWLALATYVFYIVVVLAVNVMLEVDAANRTPIVIWAIGLFSLLSMPSGVLISIRTQFAQMLEEKQAGHRLTAVAGFNKDVEHPFIPGTHSEKEERTCACGCGRTFMTNKNGKKVTFNAACRKRLSRARA